MVKFFGSNGQPFISKRQKDLSEKSILFVLESSGKMSHLGISNPTYMVTWSLYDDVTTKHFLGKRLYFK